MEGNWTHLSLACSFFSVSEIGGAQLEGCETLEACGSVIVRTVSQPDSTNVCGQMLSARPSQIISPSSTEQPQV